MIEADMLPLDLYDESRGIVQGIEVNAWSRPLAFHLHKVHPANVYGHYRPETKRVSADRIEHLALVDRIGQLRGISVFASVINRLADVKDYEDSERIAAKVAASLTAYIRKGQPDLYSNGLDGGAASAMLAPGSDQEYRDLRMVPGLIMDDLLPGEDIG